MTDRAVSVLKLTDEMRKKIAQDLGIPEKLEKVPQQITIVGVKSSEFGGKSLPGGISVLINA